MTKRRARRRKVFRTQEAEGVGETRRHDRSPSSFNGSLRSVMPLISRAQRCLTLMNFMSSTSDRSTATIMCWMKKTTDAISDTARKESVQVALLQTHGEEMLR